MIALQETTQWEFPNHIYITNDTRCRLYAYVARGDLIELKKPVSFSTTNRKFKKIENVWLHESGQPIS